MREGGPPRAWAVGALCAASAVAGCASRRPISRVEDKARLDVPIAVCRRPLTPSELGDAGAPSLEAYWRVMMPGFRGMGLPLAPSDADCVGDRFDPPGSLSSAPLAPDDAVVVPADDGSQVVWLRAYRRADGAAVGPLALVRPRPSEIDVYAVGRYGGSVKHSRFVSARLGATRVVAAIDDGCADAKVDAECDSTLRFYGVVGGELDELAESPAARLRYGTLAGVGRVQRRLTTDPPVFDKLTVRVHERVQVRDSADEAVRKAEGDRVFTLASGARLVAAQESLWTQISASP